jgi:hypothetical protein
MNKEELTKILEDHRRWVSGEGGKRADLCEADLGGTDLSGASLRDANLRSAYLRGASLSKADLRSVDLRDANLRNADLSGANLCEADLRSANLRGASLRGVDLDYSAWPLCCYDLRVSVDERIAKQLAYHLLSVCDHSGIRIDNLREFANGFHRVKECGKLKEQK